MPSPNLLNLNPNKSNSLEQNIEKHHLTIAAMAKLSIIVVQTVFVILLGVNSSTISNVGKLENEVRALETQLRNKAESTKRVQDTIRKTERLKALQAQRPLLSDKIEKALNSLPPQITLVQAAVKPDSMEVVIETQSPIEASLLISSYFNQELASQVAINSANLSTSTGRFITNMEVTFK